MTGIDIDSLDPEHRQIALERLRFLDFIEAKRPLKSCDCLDGPALVLAEGPPQEPGARRRIECGTCHRFFFWLPKARNHDKRSSSSTGLARGEFCQCCRKAGANLIGHHIIEVAEGGDDSDGNIWTLCEPCHVIVHALRRVVSLPA